MARMNIIKRNKEDERSIYNELRTSCLMRGNIVKAEDCPLPPAPELAMGTISRLGA